MKHFKTGWFLLLALALTALLFIFDPMLYQLRIRGIWHHIALGVIVAVPVALTTKPKW